ncbi:MAG: pyruvate kinase [Planctomycetaceae bacterium]|nr:pyruvate kinase [Planctomycetaceae bacterium]
MVVSSIWQRCSQTKIVATVGPACGNVERLVKLIHLGVDVFRINTAHGQREDHEAFYNLVRQAESESGHPVAVLLDLGGPKMRLGQLAGGQLECSSGDTLWFVRGEVATEHNQLTCVYPTLIDELKVGDRIMLADGVVSLKVTDVNESAAACEVLQGGRVRDRQGVNLPGVQLTAPALSDKDCSTAEWGAKVGADFISLSFVRCAEDVRSLRRLLDGCKSEAHIIAKIEKPEALTCLSEIVDEADGIMVARGDLGVEIDIAEIAVTQKRIVAECRRQRKPVIIATQMLDSMHHSRIPTRAEATDVANAILDGADACMLSGETAIGEYPEEAVAMMHRIALASEPTFGEFEGVRGPGLMSPGVSAVTSATARATVRLAETLGARMIVVATISGRAALSVSQNRSPIPTIGVSQSRAVLRRLCLYRGIVPVPEAPADHPTALVNYVVKAGRACGRLSDGDSIVLLSWTGSGSSRHNQITVHEVE